MGGGGVRGGLKDGAPRVSGWVSGWVLGCTTTRSSTRAPCAPPVPPPLPPHPTLPHPHPPTHAPPPSLQLIGAFLGTAMTLLRIVPLIIFWVKSKFLAGTERAKVGGWVGAAWFGARPCGRAGAATNRRGKMSCGVWHPLLWGFVFGGDVARSPDNFTTPAPLCTALHRSLCCRRGCGRTRPPPTARSSPTTQSQSCWAW